MTKINGRHPFESTGFKLPEQMNMSVFVSRLQHKHEEDWLIQHGITLTAPNITNRCWNI